MTVAFHFGRFSSWSLSSERRVLPGWKVALNSLISFVFNSLEGFWLSVSFT